MSQPSRASEDSILACLARHFPATHPSLLLGRGDDCAVLKAGTPLCVSSDLFLEDVHFRRSYFTPEEIGHKALAVNVSDIAACGGRPLAFTLALGLPDDVVLQRNITEEQYQLYKTYVERGCRIIQELQIVDRVAETVRYHRENYDGTGYLEGLQGEAIPLLSRILAVADFTDRHRRWGETDAQIAAALRECAGHAFDPQCVEVMCGMLTERT